MKLDQAYADRNGGYTRVVKTRIRRGDAAQWQCTIREVVVTTSLFF